MSVCVDLWLSFFNRRIEGEWFKRFSGMTDCGESALHAMRRKVYDRRTPSASRDPDFCRIHLLFVNGQDPFPSSRLAYLQKVLIGVACHLFNGLTRQTHHAKLAAMKRKKAPVEKASTGTVLAARARAEGNKWTDAEREKLGEEFMKIYYGGETKPTTTRRR